LTETEPCSLEEEFSYQKEWEQDNQHTSNSELLKFHSLFKQFRTNKTDQIERKL
jgi:hypothetical protein